MFVLRSVASSSFLSLTQVGAILALNNTDLSPIPPRSYVCVRACDVCVRVLERCASIKHKHTNLPSPGLMFYVSLSSVPPSFSLRLSFPASHSLSMAVSLSSV